MAINDYARRFSEEKYATKNEVAKELKMSMVDAIWSPILKYRAQFNKYLQLRTIQRNSFAICLCEAVSANADALEMKLLRYVRSFNEQDALDKKTFSSEQIAICLENVAKRNGIESSVSYLTEMVNGFSRSVSDGDKLLSRYYESLKYLVEHSSSPIDMDFVAGLYSKMTGNNELTSLYRNNSSFLASHVAIDRLYNEAPADTISGLMDSLYEFIARSDLNQTVKALIVYYYVNYIKPFQFFNDEMAVLLAKGVLAQNDINEAAISINLESLLVNKLEEQSRVFNDVQRYADVTYFLTFAINALEELLNGALNNIIEVSRRAIRKDFYRPEEKKLEEKVIESSKEETNPVVEVQVKEEPKVEPKPVEVIQPKIVNKPKVEKIEVLPESDEREKLAVSYIPPQLDEKEAARLEAHLLECDPLLRKGDAKFYARHCTLGKMYTIDQFKKYNKCAYETARVGMDHLTELGYYEKKQIKNKFIYSPIARK